MSDRHPNRREWLGGATALAAAAAATKTIAQDAPASLDIDLTGKSVLITGCSSGFGRLSALHFARLGGTVIASMRNLDGGRRPEAKELAKTAKEESLKLSIVEIDVLKDDQVKAGVSAAEEIAGGALDVVINNAGIGQTGPVEVSDIEATQLVFDTNLFGYMRVAKAALPAMRAAGEGLIVNVSSQLGRLVLPNLGLYCGSKFGLEAMFEAMAYELAPFGVETTIIQPGGYPTQIWEKGLRYYNDLIARVSDAEKEAYAAHLQIAEGFFQAGRQTTDPMDIPRAIAEIISMPAGRRPLRRPVHPNAEAVEAANAALAQLQTAVLSRGSYASWHKAVTD